MTLVIIAGGIDLSVGSMLALSCGLGVTFLNNRIGAGTPEGAAALLAAGACVVSGALMGFVNGVLVSVGRIAPFIATLGGLVAYRSLVLAMAEGGEIRSSSPTEFSKFAEGGISLPFVTVGGGSPLVVTWGMIAFVLIALVFGFLLSRTPFGRRVIAVGANDKAAALSAISVGRVRTCTYILLGVCTGIAALFLSSRFNSVSSSQNGLYMELDAIAAVVIGGTSLSGGRGRIWGTVVGVLLLGMINSMLVAASVSNYWQGFVKGVIILLAVLIQRGQRDR
jgi:ribose transport system permease protein